MGQTIAQQTAGAVRAELARRQISGREMSRALGWAHTTTLRRLNGSSPFDVDELVAVANFLGVPASSLLNSEPALSAAP